VAELAGGGNTSFNMTEDPIKGSMIERISVYHLPPDKESLQPLIECAEEDLLCAIHLYRRGACNYLPIVNVCYLLHQAIEKWLKVLINVRGMTVSMKGNNAHNLRSFFETIAQQEPQFRRISSKIEEVDGRILEHRYPGNLRYNETAPEIKDFVEVLIVAAFETRRAVKRCLKREDL
jgi:HEPN domain-containing protein